MSGNTLIEVAYRDKSVFPKGIPIRDLVGKAPFWVYSFDIDRQSLVLGRAIKVWKTGYKPIYRVKYNWKFAKGNKVIWLEDFMDVTANHPFLLKRYIKHDPFLGHRENCDYLSISEGLRIGHSLQPFLRTGDWVSTGNGKRLTEGRFLLSNKLGRRIRDGEDCHHRNTNHIDDSWDNLEALTVAEHARVHAYLDNPMSDPVARKRHRESLDRPEYREGISRKISDYLKDNPDEAERRANQLREAGVGTRFKRGMRWITDGDHARMIGGGVPIPDGWRRGRSKNTKRSIETNHKITGVEYLGMADVYDMEVEKYHNFAAHGIFVHNSDEDRKGRPWQGTTGRLLARTLGELGVNLERDCLSTNAVACRPMTAGGDNREPTPHEMACCRARYLLPAIERRRPRVILLLGGAACASVLGSLCDDVDDHITKWRGWRVPVPEWGAWVCPTFHPSFVVRSDDKPEVATIWRQDLAAAIGMLDVTVPAPEDLRRLVTILRTEDDIVEALRVARRARLFSYDYETTGLLPSHHEIVCASFATGSDRVYAFEWTGSERVTAAWRRVLAEERVGKISHNLKFENNWSIEHVGVENIRWAWDSMIASHILDNRVGLCGLKLQAFLNFGAPDWGAVVEPYLKATDPKDPTSPNRVREFVRRYGMDDLLIYNGIDSVLAYRLATRQMEAIGCAISLR